MRGRRDPPAPLLDFGSDADDADADDDDDDNDHEDDDRRKGASAPLTKTTPSPPPSPRAERKARLEAAYARVVRDPSLARDGDVRLYFKKRRLLAERSALEDGDGGRRGRGGGGDPLRGRSYVDDNDALPRPETAGKLSEAARAQVIGERGEALAEALGWRRGDDGEGSGGDHGGAWSDDRGAGRPSLDGVGGGGGGGNDDSDGDLPALCSALFSRHPGLLAKPTSELATAVRGHARSARLVEGGATVAAAAAAAGAAAAAAAATLPARRVLVLAAEAPRLLLAHPDAAEARAGLLGRALVAGGSTRGGTGEPQQQQQQQRLRSPAALAAALMWRHPAALGTARARPLVEWAEALAAAVARAGGPDPSSDGGAGLSAPPRAAAAGGRFAAHLPRGGGGGVRGVFGTPRAGVAEAMGVLAAGVEFLRLSRVAADDPIAEQPEGYARDAWLLRAGPGAASDAVAALEARLLLPPPPLPPPSPAGAALPLFPLLRAEPALLLAPPDPLRLDAWTRLDGAFRALEALFSVEQEEQEQRQGGGGGGGAGAARVSSAAAASAARAVLLAPRLLRALGGDGQLAALQEALSGMAQTDWLLSGGQGGDGTGRPGGGPAAARSALALALARRHPRLLLAAVEGRAKAGGAAAAMDARADRLARELGRALARPPSPRAVRRAAQNDPSLLAAPPALVRRALLRLASALAAPGPGGAGPAASQRLWDLLADLPPAAGGGAWAAAERGWLPLQLRALCAATHLPAEALRRALLLQAPYATPPPPAPPAAACPYASASPSPSPPALAALAASPAELREGHARLAAACRRLAERRRWREDEEEQWQQRGEGGARGSAAFARPPAAAAEARLRSALLQGAHPSLALAALAPGLNAAAVAALDACAPDAGDEEAVEAVSAALCRDGRAKTGASCVIAIVAGGRRTAAGGGRRHIL